MDFSQLHNDGYYVGNIYDIVDSIELDKIITLVKSVSVEKERYYYYRHTCGLEPQSIPLSEKETRKQRAKEENLDVMQQWAEIVVNDVLVMNFLSKFRNMFQQTLFIMYPELHKDNIKYLDTITYYENGDFITPHNDGDNQGRLCVILAYLSDINDYNDGGGKLIIHDEKKNIYEEILPIKGNYVILDFKNNNIKHSVEIVKNNFERYCYLSFIYNTDLMEPDQKVVY